MFSHAPYTSDRFDDSFFMMMIRDFFLLLILVFILELGIKFAIVFYDFQTQAKEDTEHEAALLAADVKSIMLNKGGPVAARTVYPILKKTKEDLGLHIAIEPEEKTVKAIKRLFQFTPRGIPAQWKPGTHHEATVALRAEQFCRSCHSNIKIGEVIGTVTVRRYLADDIDQWWSAVTVAGFIGLAKTILHTVFLYFLLTLRMEPLLSLRALVAKLSKAGSDLSYRVEIKSADEFGELARDLNLFLDRITQIVEDLGEVLDEVSDLNNDLSETQGRIADRMAKLEAATLETKNQCFSGQADSTVLNRDWLAGVTSALAMIADRPEITDDVKARLSQLTESLDHQVQKAETLTVRYDQVLTSLSGVTDDLGQLRDAARDMESLEHKMQSLAGRGRRLIARLTADYQPDRIEEDKPHA